jgi:predicted nucleic acid-binding protein
VNGRLAYLDSSAYVKLPLKEREHEALRVELAEWDGYVSSALLAIESVRACARYGSAYGTVARSWLFGMTLLPLDDEVLDMASGLVPAMLRSLDALHLATAITTKDEIGAFVTYDRRLGAAAKKHGLPVVHPGLA